MDIALYIPTLEVYGETIPLTIGIARFDLMGNDPPTTEELPSLSSSFGATLQRIVAEGERVWIGPSLEAALSLYAFNALRHPQLRDSETLFSLVPHTPHDYYSGASPGKQAAVMVERLRSCVSALICAGL